jgi:hypothetical protein
MADGDIILLDNHKFSVKLLDAHNGASAGPWVEVPPQYSIWSIHADYLGTDSVQIQVSNAATNPTSSVAGGIFGFYQGTTMAVSLTGNTNTATVLGWQPSVSFRWIRAVKTGTATTCTVILEADSNQ